MKKKICTWCKPAAALLMFAFLLLLIAAFLLQQVKTAKNSAQAFLMSFQEAMVMQLSSVYNYADDLALIVKTDGNIDKAAAQILTRPASVYISMLQDNTVTKIYPQNSEWTAEMGHNIAALDYAYTLARARGEVVIEGPITLGKDKQSLFLTIVPLFANSVYQGEAMVALDANMVLDACNFEQITAHGYQYEVWRVNPLDGHKEVIRKSEETMDLSSAVEAQFALPTMWTISIMPKSGWYNKGLLVALLLVACGITAGFTWLLSLAADKKELQATIAMTQNIDAETGFYSRKGFLQQLAIWTHTPEKPFALIYIVLNNYNRIAQSGTSSEQRLLLEHLKNCLNGYVKSEHLVARVGEHNFVLAVRETMSQIELENLKKGLMLELIYKAVIHGERVFLIADATSVQFPEDGTEPETLMQTIFERFSEKICAENPLRDMAQKCEQLAQGDESVQFGEYADADINHLAKALMQYRKKMEKK